MSADGRTRLHLNGEIRGEVYRDLLQLAARFEMFAVLVVRRPQDRNGPAQTVLDNLSPWLIRQDWTTEWPGTRLFEHRAWVGRYAMASDVVDSGRGARVGQDDHADARVRLVAHEAPVATGTSVVPDDVAAR